MGGTGGFTFPFGLWFQQRGGWELIAQLLSSEAKCQGSLPDATFSELKLRLTCNAEQKAPSQDLDSTDKISLWGPRANILHVFACLPTCYLFPREKEKKEYRVDLDTCCDRYMGVCIDAGAGLKGR